MSDYIDRVTIGSTTKIIRDTTLESKAAASGGTATSLVTTGEKYTWNQKYSKPSGGIPASDIASGVIPDVSIYAPKASPEFTGKMSMGRVGSYGANSTAFGAGVTAAGDYSHAEGQGTEAAGNHSHAEGGGARATANGAHAEGEGTQAGGVCAHAEGGGTKAIGPCTHAEGGSTQALGQNAHAEGYTTVAGGDNSHAEGKGTSAMSLSQHVSGEYNVIDSTGTTSTHGTYVQIVGNGTNSSNCSNAYALDWNGNGYFAGDVYVGCNNDSTGGTKLMRTPTTAGTAGQVLTSDGNGGQSWQTPSGGGGTVTDVQVNGTSVLSGGVANVDISGKVDKVSGGFVSGIAAFNSSGNLYNSGISEQWFLKDNYSLSYPSWHFSKGEIFIWKGQPYVALTEMNAGTGTTLSRGTNVAQMNPDLVTNSSHTISYLSAKINKLTVRCDLGTISSLPVTKTFNGVTSDMTVTHYEVGTPKAFSSALTITTAENTITISGTMTSGSSSTLVVTLSTTTDLTEST